MRQVVQTDRAPRPVGPYSQAIIAGEFVYVAGQGPADPATGRKVPGGVGPETEQVLKNIQAILEAAGTNMANVVKVNVYLKDITEFGAMNEVYKSFFPSDTP